MKPTEGVILDIDGTLVNSNDAHAHAWVAAFAEQGIEMPFDKVRRHIGMGADKLLPTVAGISESSRLGQKLSQRRGQIFTERFLPLVRPFPQVTELLERMHADGVRLTVASSAKKEELHHLLQICGADKFIESRTSADDASRSKPDPDIVQAALDQLGLPPEHVLMLGDTPFDIEAAQRAGIGAVAVRCGGWDDEDLAGALAVYDDPADLLRSYGTSPLAQAVQVAP